MFELLKRVRVVLGLILELSKLSETVELELWHAAAELNLIRDGIRGLKTASEDIKLKWSNQDLAIPTN